MELYYIATIALIAINIVMAIFVYLKDYKNAVNYTFAALILSITSWILVNFMADNSTGYAALIWTKLTFVTTAFIAWLLLLFVLIFPLRKKSLPLVSNAMLFTPNLIVCLLMLTNLIVKGVDIQSWGVNVIFGPANIIFAIYFLGYVASATGILIRNTYETRGTTRFQMLYVLLGLALSISFATITNLIIPFTLNIFYPSKYGHFFTLIFIVFTTYAITKTRLMNISIVISRTVAWVITILSLGSIYILLAWLYRTFVTAQIDWIFLAATVLYGVLVGVSFQKIRLFLQTAADRAFIKGWYDYREVLRKVATGLAKALTREDIVKTLYPIFQDDIDISESHLYFLDRNSATFIEWDPQTLEPRRESALTKDYSLVKQVSAQKEVVAFDKKLCVPSFSGGDLVALFVLGKKRSEDEYNDDDIELFRTVSEYVAIALEYIVKPYEEVKEKFESTEKKLFETEKQLERSQRLASLGTVAAGVAHEIRNPLAVISLKTQNLPDTEELRDFKNIVIANTERATAIIKQMIMLSKPKERKEIEINLNELIDATLKLFAISRIRLILDLKELPPIKCDPDEMKQVFINLIDNAIHAMPEGGDLTIASRYIEEPPSVQIEISDTGTGIPDDIKEKIFDPFFSTRHEGAGLGLSIAYRIVREHGGSLEFKTKVGKGTTFILKFPAIKT